MGVKKTTEIFKQEVYDAEGNNYVVLGNYVNGKTKIKMKHTECGNVYKVTPHDFLGGRRCPNCRYKNVSSKLKKTFSQFSEEVTNLGNGEYKVFPPYVNNKTKIKFVHITCGHDFMMKPSDFIKGNRCPYERGEQIAESKRKSTEQFMSEVEACYGKGHYELLEDYKGADNLIRVKHLDCGNIYDTRPADFVRGHGCPECAYKTRASKIGVNQRTSLEEVQNSVYLILGNDYHIMLKPEEYKGNRQKITIKHDKCGHTFVTRYSDIQCYGYGCPYCSDNKSHGETLILEYLINNLKMEPNKDFYYGYTGLNIRYKGKLHLDFYFPKYKVAIEYDGRQHYTPINFFGGIKTYKEMVIKDSIKDKYCLKHNIKLYRIPYTLNNKEKIFKEMSRITSGFLE